LRSLKVSMKAQKNKIADTDGNLRYVTLTGTIPNEITKLRELTSLIIVGIRYAYDGNLKTGMCIVY